MITRNAIIFFSPFLLMYRLPRVNAFRGADQFVFSQLLNLVTYVNRRKKMWSWWRESSSFLMLRLDQWQRANIIFNAELDWPSYFFVFFCSDLFHIRIHGPSLRLWHGPTVFKLWSATVSYEYARMTIIIQAARANRHTSCRIAQSSYSM